MITGMYSEYIINSKILCGILYYNGLIHKAVYCVIVVRRTLGSIFIGNTSSQYMSSDFFSREGCNFVLTVYEH